MTTKKWEKIWNRFFAFKMSTMATITNNTILFPLPFLCISWTISIDKFGTKRKYTKIQSLCNNFIFEGRCTNKPKRMSNIYAEHRLLCLSDFIIDFYFFSSLFFGNDLFIWHGTRRRSSASFNAIHVSHPSCIWIEFIYF